jgi:hypothetical protein
MMEEFLPKSWLVQITLSRVPVPSVPVMQTHSAVRGERLFSPPPVCLLSVFLIKL